MAPCKTAKPIKIRVPRQNAQRLGPSLTSHVRTVARRERTLVQLPPPVQEQPGASAASLENTSEWNSLLLSARAQRGPFWEMSTQQFLVEKESELYYDSTPLLEAARSLNANTAPQAPQSSNSNATPSAVQQQRQVQLQSQQQQQQHLQQQQQQQRQVMLANQQYGYPGSVGTPVMGHATPTRSGMAYANTPGSSGPQAQYFGGDMGTPTRPGMMNGGVGGGGATPDMYGRRITRGMSDGFPGYAG